MLTMDGLRQFGADVDSGLARCMNNEAFYLKLVEKAAGDAVFGKLSDAIAAGGGDHGASSEQNGYGLFGADEQDPRQEGRADGTVQLKGG